jgi:hypothetical protein
VQRSVDDAVALAKRNTLVDSASRLRQPEALHVQVDARDAVEPPADSPQQPDRHRAATDLATAQANGCACPVLAELEVRHLDRPCQRRSVRVVAALLHRGNAGLALDLFEEALRVEDGAVRRRVGQHHPVDYLAHRRLLAPGVLDAQHEETQRCDDEDCCEVGDEPPLWRLFCHEISDRTDAERFLSNAGPRADG